MKTHIPKKKQPLRDVMLRDYRRAKRLCFDMRKSDPCDNIVEMKGP